MACFMDMIAVFVVVVGSFVSGQLEVAKDDNIEPFSLLCRIYNVAKNPPITDVDMEEGYNIVKEIDELNRSLLEEKRHNEEEDVGNNSEAQVKPTVTRETALAQLSLNQITQKAHTILDEIGRVNVTRDIENAKAQFKKVIFGVDGNEDDLCQETVKDVDNRSVACGNTGLATKGYHAGNNLVVDFFCLCAQRNDEEGVNQVCGFYVGVKNSKIGWNESGLLGSATMWASIKGGCGKHIQKHPKSTAEARHILDAFLEHLKTGGVYRQIKCESDSPGRGKKANIVVSGSDRKAGMLGTGITINSSTEVICDGKKGDDKKQEAGGICVYYGPNRWKDNIIWLKQFQTALATVDKTNNQTTTIQRSIKKLQMLLHRAEEIYETTKVITEIQDPVVLTAFRNASGNLTVHSVTQTRNYSYKSHPYFITPWVLLL